MQPLNGHDVLNNGEVGTSADPGTGKAPTGKPLRVSLVIPAFNEAAYIGTLLESLSALESRDQLAEVIVVDNGSTDDTAQIVRAGGGTVIEKHDGTVADLRNFGAANAEGDILAFVDADCAVEPGWLTAALKHFEQPDVMAAGAYPALPPGDTTWVQRTWRLMASRPPGPPEAATWLPSANLLVRKDAFDRIQGFDATLVTGEDADICYRLNSDPYNLDARSYYGGPGVVIYDDDVAVLHFREPATLGKFFTKEIWHGLGTVDAIMCGRIARGDIPSIVALLATVLGWVLMIAGAFIEGGAVVSIAGAALIVALVSAFALRAFKKHFPKLSVFSAWLLYAVYHHARMFSIGKYFLDKFRK